MNYNNDDDSLKFSHSGSNSDESGTSYDSLPKLKSACNLCLGTEGHCKWCGCRLNWIDGKPIEYQSGGYYRCPNRNRGRSY